MSHSHKIQVVLDEALITFLDALAQTEGFLDKNGKPRRATTIRKLLQTVSMIAAEESVRKRMDSEPIPSNILTFITRAVRFLLTKTR